MPAGSWKALRDEFTITDRYAYFDHAAVSPLPRACVAAIEGYLAELADHGVAHYPQLPANILARARQLGGELLGTHPDRVFVVRSTSQGLAVAATGLPCGEGDNVVLVEREFPANIRPWLPLRRRGVEVRFVPQRQGRIQVDDVFEAVDARTVALSVSYVQFLSGFRAPLEQFAEICRRRDALLVVDAIQGLGAVPIDVERMGVDFLSADAHKWLLGPEGAGLGYASERAFERIEPAVQGWLSLRRPFDFFDVDQPLKDTAARFEEGACNMAGVHGMVGSLELLLGLGIGAVHARILELTDRLVDGLRALDWEVLSPRDRSAEKSGIVLASRHGVDFEALRERLLAAGVIVSVRGAGLRLAPHCYNDDEELARLLELLA